MMRRKIASLALYVDVSREPAVVAAKTVADIARHNGTSVQIRRDQAVALALNGAASPASFPNAADLMISLGGDGTLLEAAHIAAPASIPIVGVDFGRMGFLTQLSRDDFSATLGDLLQNGVQIEARMALEATIEPGRAPIFAVNDVHIDRIDRGRMVTFGIALGGERVADIPADGIVVSSPTGSTAYFLSAGGPILAPRLEAIGIAPICPHTLFSRPLIVGSDETIVISVPSDEAGALLFADGRRQAELPPGSRVRIAKAVRPVQFVRFDNRYFFQVLERKLHWGMSIKRSLERDNADVAGPEKSL